jgi:DNA-binding SARP family transcriptional activator
MPHKPQQPIKADALAAEVLDQLPYGIVVLDGGRRVSSANQAAVRLLWDLDRGGPPVHCHELFSCRAPGGPCEQGCLVERAALAPDALPEIRIDTALGGAVSALWVTAAALGHDEAVVLHLRPGDARDRRRRSDPHWLSGPELRISAFGRTWVDSVETPIGGSWLQQRPGQLLKYLVCERNRVVHAEEIAEALWPAAGRQSLNNVRHFMHALRAKLEPDRPRGVASSFIVTVQGGYALDRRRVRIDADEFETLAREGLAAAGGREESVAIERLEHALALYRGDLVADEPYAEWAYVERDRLRSLAAEALRELIPLLLERRDLPRAAAALERLADFEPFDGETQRLLLATYLAQGRRSEAARRYSAFKARLARDFGEEPGFTLSEARLDRPSE